MWDVFVPNRLKTVDPTFNLATHFFVVYAVCVPDRPPIRGRSVNWGSTHRLPQFTPFSASDEGAGPKS